MLRIGFDAKRLFNNFTGLGNYSRTLLANLSEYYPEQAYFLYTPRVVKNERNPFFPPTVPYLMYINLSAARVPGGVVWGLNGS